MLSPMLTLFLHLYVSQGVGAAYLAAHAAKTGSRLYLHVTKVKVPKPVAADAPPPPTTLDGLLQASKDENRFDVTEVLSVVAVDGDSGGGVTARAPFPHADLPTLVGDAAAAVHAHASAGTLEEVRATEPGSRRAALPDTAIGASGAESAKPMHAKLPEA
jgi:hypothetical protein